MRAYGAAAAAAAETVIDGCGNHQIGGLTLGLSVVVVISGRHKGQTGGFE